MKKCEQYINDFLPADFFDRIEKGDFNRIFYPVYADRKSWGNAAKSKFADMILKGAELVEEKQVPMLLFSNYRQYVINGNRIDYETPYFKRRKDLAFLALAMCLTADKEKYMPRLLDYTVAILEESSWCLPAHARWAKNNADRWRFCDLFAAETGAIMALLYLVLGEELEQEVPGIAERIRTKTLEQTINTVYDKNIVHWWDTDEEPKNWTVWCSSNCIITSLLLENNGKKRVSHLKRFLANTSRFINFNSDDGYCPEGPSYYMKANLMVFQTLLWLEKAIPGSADKLFADEKIKKMLEFISDVRIGNQNVVSYSDARCELNLCLALIVTAGKYFNSELLYGFDGLEKFRLGACGDFMESLLAYLFDYPQEIPGGAVAGKAVTVFKDKLAVMRSSLLSLSFKAGYNKEPHNHNDLGSFELFSGNTPVIVDAGTETYAQIHFSDRRYTLWYTRGSGHNGPVFGQYEQQEGLQYTSIFTVDKDNTIKCDLSKAYPVEAGVESAERIIKYSSNKVTVEDIFSLKKSSPATITLLTPCVPEKVDETTLRLGDVTLKLENLVLEEVTEIPEMFYGAESCWGTTLKAVKLKSCTGHTAMIFSC